MPLPNLTIIPAHRVAAVAVVPWGAHPSYVQGYYTRDDDHFRRYGDVSRTAEGTLAHLDRWVQGVDRERYLSMIDTGTAGRRGNAMIDDTALMAIAAARRCWRLIGSIPRL